MSAEHQLNVFLAEFDENIATHGDASVLADIEFSSADDLAIMFSYWLEKIRTRYGDDRYQRFLFANCTNAHQKYDSEPHFCNSCSGFRFEVIDTWFAQN